MKYKIITDKEEIRKALCAPKSMPDSFLQPLKPIGESKFKGDNFVGVYSGWSVNDKFTKGETYPVYDMEGEFVVGSDGKGYKMTPIAWSKVKYL